MGICLYVNIMNDILLIKIVVSVTIIILGFSISFLIWYAHINYCFIKQYKSLMKPLESITILSSNISVWGVTHVLQNNRNLSESWVTYSEETGKKNNNAFIDLNTGLNKLIRAPYLLIFDRTVSNVRREFHALVNVNKEMYIKFIEMLNTQGIATDAFDYTAFKMAHDAFYDALKRASYRHDNDRFDELREDFSQEFFSFLYDEPKWQKTYVVY